MALKHNHFKVIYAYSKLPHATQREIANATGWDLPPSTPLARNAKPRGLSATGA